MLNKNSRLSTQLNSNRKHNLNFKNLFSIFLLLISLQANAENPTNGTNYLEKLNVKQELTMYSSDLMGDTFDTGTGAFGFSHVDVSLSGNFNLPVEIRRKYVGSGNFESTGREFSTWGLDLPHIRTNELAVEGQLPTNGIWETGVACSAVIFSTSSPQGITPGGKLVNPIPPDFWNGDNINIPGVYSGKVLAYGELDVTTGSENAKNRYLANHWKVDCFNSANGHEGFRITTLDGTVYTFEVMRRVKGKIIELPPHLSNLTSCYDESGAEKGCEAPSEEYSIEEAGESDNARFQLYHTFMLPSEVTDRFGNSVSYTYGSNGRLEQITSSDNRQINIYYNGNNFISSITAGTKTYQYNYQNYGSIVDYGTLYWLDTITLPNSQQWNFDYPNLSGTVKMVWEDVLLGRFSIDVGFRTNPEACIVGVNGEMLSINHPEGASGTFYYRETSHRRTDVPEIPLRVRWYTGTTYYEPLSYQLKPCTPVLSLARKELNNSDGGTLIWLYDYLGANGNFEGKTKNSLTMHDELLPYLPTDIVTGDLKTTRVTLPDGSKVEHHSISKFGWMEGQEVIIDFYDTNGSTLLRRVANDFEQSSEQHGTSWMQYDETSKKQTFNKKVWIEQNDNNYYVEKQSFNVYDAPTKVKESNDFNALTKYTQFGYLHDAAKSLYNLPTTVEVSSNDSQYVEVSNTTYKTKSATNNEIEYTTLVFDKYYSFGALSNTFVDYHADGNFQNIKDSNNNTYTYDSFYRGIPRTLRAPGITPTTTSAVNYDGTIASVNDFEGNLTSYDYDSVGRLTNIDYPLEVGNEYWLDTDISYGFVDATDLAIPNSGLVSGQFKQTITRGGSKVTRYFDGLLRPVLVREEDTVESITNYQRSNYDYNNQVVFQSIKSAVANELSGVASVYDGLGRIKTTTDLSGTITTNYLSLNQKRVNNRKGFNTTYHYQVFGAPSYNNVIKIESPEPVVTDIDRDIYGKMDFVTQTDKGVTPEISSTRNYYYDDRQRLCRTYNPETGYTAMYYDNAGLLKWQLIDTSTNYCNAGATAPTGATIMAYTGTGKIDFVNYPSGTQDLDFAYDNNGNMTSSVRGGVQWAYTYNSLNQVKTETLSLDTQTFNLSYSFDILGQLSHVTYPSGRRIETLPNALGQQTKAGSYAFDAQYHPTGQLAQFTYGNGQIYSITLNTEKLPLDVGVTGKAELTYAYDANHNITSITDNVDVGENRSLSYDDLDRLDTATGPWGSGSFTYDGFGNIKSKTLGALSYTYEYDPTSNLLTDVTGSKNYNFGYDDHGNVSNNGYHSFTYDKANLLLSVNSGAVASFNYDANKKRVKVVEGGQTFYQVYNQAGQFMHKFNATTAEHADYIYMAGKQIAKVVSSPPIPTGLASPDENIGGSYTVSWDSLSGAAYYELQERVNSGSWALKGTVDIASYDVSNGGASNVYEYQVRACNNYVCGDYSAISSTTVVPPPAAPTLSSPSIDNDGIYTVSWNLVSTATSYQLEERVNGGAWSLKQLNANNTYNSSGRTSSTYEYRVRACISAGCGSYSATSSTIVIYTPTGLSLLASNYDGTYSVSWNPVSGVTSYQLEERVDGGSWSLKQSNASNTYNASDRASGVYEYQVKACIGVVCGSYSAIKSTTVTLTPTGLNSPPIGYGGTYFVSWNPVSTATRYELQERLNDGDWNLIHSNASTIYNVSGRASGLYYYRVRACNIYGCSGYSAHVTTPVPPSAPTGLSSPADVSGGSYIVSWNAVTSAEFYELQERVNGGSWSPKYTALGTTSYTVSNGSTANDYDYRVRACNTYACGSYSGISTTTVTPIPAIPTGLSSPTSDTDGTYGVSWNSVTYATRYELQERVNGGSWIQKYSGASTSYNVSNGSSSKLYEYRVRACNVNGCSSYSAIKATAIPPAAPTGLSSPANVSNGSSYIVLWNSATNASYYLLQERVNGGSWSPKYTAIGTTSYTVSNGPTAKVYDYRVRACNTYGCGSYSAITTTTVTPLPAIPTGLSSPATNTNGSYVVLWNSVSNATSYKLQERVNGGSWVQKYLGGSISYNASGRADNFYEYRVRACNISGCSSYSGISSTTVVSSPPSIPTGLSSPTSDTDGSYVVSWNSVGSAASYQLQERVSGGSWSLKYSGANTAYNVSNGSISNFYEYRVRACNIAGCSSYSSTTSTFVEDQIFPPF